jgi:hypothetical protein
MADEGSGQSYKRLSRDEEGGLSSSLRSEDGYQMAAGWLSGNGAKRGC